MDSTKDTIRVAIRVRPINEKEQTQVQTWKSDSQAITLCTPEGKQVPNAKFTFASKNAEIYEHVGKDITLSAMNGINGTIFAYGQTSSGKTFTMKGLPNQPGITVLSILDVFSFIEQSLDREYLLRVSYLEIYNEVLRDLLAPDQNKKLKIHEDLERGIFVGDLKEEIVTSAEQVLSLMQMGEVRRHVGATNMNEHSSRSHTIFKIVIESRERQEEEEEDMFSEFSSRSKKKNKRGSNGSNNSEGGGGAVKVSSIHLVDLAGSERISQTGAEGLRLKEGGHINKSLLTLGTVIQKLSSSQGGHVPFRDSKLTRILQNALGGNSRTAIICTIAPAAMHTEESLSTLQFATRAKTIKNKPEVNEVVDDKAMLKRLQKEVHELRSQLGKMKEDVLHEEMKLLQSEKMKIEEDRSLLELKLRSQEDKIQKYAQLIVVSSLSSSNHSSKPERSRRETWCPTVRSRDASILFPAPLRKGGINLVKESSDSLMNKSSIASETSSKESSISNDYTEDSDDSKSADIEYLRNLLAESDSIKEGLSKENMDYQKRMEEMIERIKLLEKENEELNKEKENEELKKKEEEQQSASDSQLQEMLELSRKHETEMQREIDILKNNTNYDELEKQQLRKDLEELIVKLDSLQNQQYDLQVEYQKLQERNEELEEETKELKESLDTLQSNKEVTNHQNSEIESKYKIKVEELERQIAQMKDLHEISLSQNQLLLADSSSLRVQISSVQEEKKKIEESKVKMEEELKRVFEELQNVVSSHSSAISSLEASEQLNQQIKEKQEKLQTEIEEIIKENLQLSNLNKELQRNLDSLDIENRSLVSSLQKTSSELESTKEDIHKMRRETIGHSIGIDKERKEIEKNSNQLSLLKDKLKLVQQEKSSLASEKTLLDKQVKDLKKQLSDLVRELEKSNSGSSKIKELTSHISILEKKCDSLTKGQEKWKSQAQSLEVDMNNSRNYADSILIAKKKLEEELEASRLLTNDLQVKMSSLLQDLSYKDDIITSLKHHIEEHRSSIRLLEVNIQNLLLEKQTMEEINKNMKQSKEDTDRKLFETTEKLSYALVDLDELKESLSSQRKSNDQLSIEKQQIVEQFTESQLLFEEKSSEWSLSHSTLLSNISSLENSIQSYSQSLEQANSSLISLQSSFESVSIQLRDLQQQKDILEHESRDLHEHNNLLSSNLSSLSQQKEDLEKLLLQSKLENENNYSQLRTLHSEMNDLQQINSSLVDQVNTLQKESSENSDLLFSQKSEISLLSLQIQSQQSEKIELESKIEKLQTDNNSLESSVQRLSVELSSATIEKDKMKEELSSLQQQISQYSKEIDDLEIKLDSKSNELSVLHSKYTQLDQSILTITQERNSLQRLASELSSHLDSENVFKLEAEELSAKLRTLQQEFSQVLSQKRSFEEQSKVLSEESKTFKEQKRKQTADFLSLKQNMQSELSIAKQQVILLSSSNEQLEQKNKELVHCKKELEQQIEALKQRMIEMASEFKKQSAELHHWKKAIAHGTVGAPTLLPNSTKGNISLIDKENQSPNSSQFL